MSDHFVKYTQDQIEELVYQGGSSYQSTAQSELSARIEYDHSFGLQSLRESFEGILAHVEDGSGSARGLRYQSIVLKYCSIVIKDPRYNIEPVKLSLDEIGNCYGHL